jgi:hypothetical protein
MIFRRRRVRIEIEQSTLRMSASTSDALKTAATSQPVLEVHSPHPATSLSEPNATSRFLETVKEKLP